MEVIDILKRKKVKLKVVEKWGTCLRKRWEDNFANHLSIDEKKEIYLYNNDGYCGYLWHVFSYEKRECLIGEEAEQAFNNETKNNCYVFYQRSDDVMILENATDFKASDLKNEIDVYVVDREFTWTFVKTHETEYCGPYFSHR